MSGGAIGSVVVVERLRGEVVAVAAGGAGLEECGGVVRFAAGRFFVHPDESSSAAESVTIATRKYICADPSASERFDQGENGLPTPGIAQNISRSKCFSALSGAFRFRMRGPNAFFP